MNIPLTIGISLYMILMLVIGYWSSRRIHNLADFLVAGRGLPFYLALGTLFATWFGAGTCMGASGTAFSEGLIGVVADPFAAGISLILAGIFYVGLLRRLDLLTVTDVFGRYYSRGSEIFASILMVPVYIGWLASQMVALGYLLNLMTGIDTTTGIVISTLIILIYTYAGGMWAVTLTDFVQVIILVAGLLLLYPVVMHDVGGLAALKRATPAEFWTLLPEPGFQNWTSYLGQWALLGLGTVVGQDLIQRSLSCRTESIARHSAWVAGVLYLTIGLIPVFLGMAGGLLMPEIEDPEMILPALAIEYLPQFGMILFVGALVSAIMSSADSSLLAASSVVSQNILRVLMPQTEEIRLLRWTRITTIVLAFFSMAAALYFQRIYHLMVNSWATLFVGLLVPVTAALYWRRASREAAWASMIVGTATWLGRLIFKTADLEDIADPVFYEAALFGGLASLAAYLLVTWIRRPAENPVPPATTLTPK